MGFLPYEVFAERASAVQERIRVACQRAGRVADDVRLLPVTKTHGPWAVEFAYRYGLDAVGENKVQEAIEKRPLCEGLKLRWELIGTLQTNKVKLAVQHFTRVQSVDRPRLVAALQKQCQLQARARLPVLLQINAGNDPAKHGADPAEADALVEAALAAPALDVQGLMTIAPLSDDPEVARRTFARLRELRDALEHRHHILLPELSMGMSADMDAAIQEGSTLVRVGTALFGPREQGREEESG